MNILITVIVLFLFTTQSVFSGGGTFEALSLQQTQPANNAYDSYFGLNGVDFTNSSMTFIYSYEWNAIIDQKSNCSTSSANVVSAQIRGIGNTIILNTSQSNVGKVTASCSFKN